jgi:hypothetical protein
MSAECFTCANIHSWCTLPVSIVFTNVGFADTACLSLSVYLYSDSVLPYIGTSLALQPASLTWSPYMVARFFLVQNTKMGENIPNYHELYQMSIKYNKRPQNGPSVHKIYQHLPLQGPPKFTQIWIFGLKTNHLAALSPYPLASFSR